MRKRLCQLGAQHGHRWALRVPRQAEQRKVLTRAGQGLDSKVGLWAQSLISVVIADRGHQGMMGKSPYALEAGRKLQATGILCARITHDPGWDGNGSFLGQAINQEY